MMLMLAMPVLGHDGSVWLPAPDGAWYSADVNPCLYARPRCPPALDTIYYHLYRARLEPGIDNWRLNHWWGRLGDYYRFQAGRYR